MSISELVTAEQLQRRAVEHCELIRGEVVAMPPAGAEHGIITGRLMHRLGAHVYSRNLGEIVTGETGFLIAQDPDTVRVPDVSFLSNETLERYGVPKGFFPGPPDLAVEVVSPSDRYGDVDEKIEMWLAAGTRMVWVVHPARRERGSPPTGSPDDIASGSGFSLGGRRRPGIAVPPRRPLPGMKMPYGSTGRHMILESERELEMSITEFVTAEQLLRENAKACELIRGEIIGMSPAGAEHGWIAAEITGRLYQYALQRRTGRAFTAEAGFLIARDPDTVRVPDVSFLSNETLSRYGVPRGYFPGPPDLAVEVVSPSDRFGDVDEKIEMWLAAGARLVWVIYPSRRNAEVHLPGQPVLLISEDGALTGGDVIPGFECRLGDLFPERV